MKIYYYTNLDIERQSFADRDVLSVEDLTRYKDVGTLSASLPMKPDAAMRDMNITEAAKKFKSKVTLDVQEDDTSYRYRSLMAKPQLVLKFSLPIYVEIPVGAWCEYQGETYSLNTPQNIKKNGNRNIEYTLNMGTAQDNMSLYKIRNSVDKRLKFSMCAKPHEFIEEIVKNLNERDGAGRWKVGTCIDANEKTIEFNHTYIDAGLSQVAEIFETEYEIDNYTINLCKVEYFKESPLPLSYGKGNGFMPGVGRTTPSNEMPIKRLYVQGGDKNIDRSKYGSAELLLPKSQTLEYEGRTYQSDADGFYIERIDKISDAVKEDSLDCSECYPSRVGAVTSVIAVKPEKNFYDFTDTSIPADLNFNDYIIEGETATIIFQSGMLAGKEFEFKYKHNERRFEIVPQEIDGQVMPNETFIPAVGNTYAIFGIMLPESYICNNEAKEGASWDMFREAARHMYENEDQKFTFQGTLQSLYAKRNWVNIGGKLKVGGYVHFSDTQFAKDGVDIRITGIKDYLTSPYSPTVEISNSVTGQSLTSKLREIDSQEVVIEDNHKAAIQFTKRRFRDAQETISMLEGALDNFSESINPITVQTMAMLVGDESLQFRFVKDKRSAVVVPFNVYYDDETKQLIINQTYYLQHLTIGINTITSGHTSDDYKTWEMNTFASARLDNADAKYYLYAKVSVNTSERGDFMLSETVIDIYKEDGYYYLLVGILNSEYEETRSFVELYGYTEILPGRITVDKIVSTDGKSWMDLSTGQMRLGEKLYYDGDALYLDFLFSEGANIAGWIFKNNRLESENGNVYLDGKNGKVRLAGTIQLSTAYKGAFADANIFYLPAITSSKDIAIGYGIEQLGKVIRLYNSSPFGGANYRIDMQDFTVSDNFTRVNSNYSALLRPQEVIEVTCFEMPSNNGEINGHWDISGRFSQEMFMTENSKGRNIKALAMGILYGDNPNNINLSGHMYDGRTLANAGFTVERKSTGSYTISFPSGTLTSGYRVFMTGYGGNWKGSYLNNSNTSFDVQISDDASLNDGCVAFMILDYNWFYDMK